MAFSEDLADFINLDTPGSVAATIGAATVVGLFDADYRDVLGVAGSGPQIVVRDVDIPGITQGAAVTIGATGYTVTAIEPDGGGLTTLKLQES